MAGKVLNMAKNSKFGAAFKSARASGKKEFSFNGKKYNTKTADDVKKTPVPAEKPKASEPTGPKTRARNTSGGAPSKDTGPTTRPKNKAPAKKEHPLAIKTGTKERSQAKAAAAKAAPAPQQDYPRPAKDVGIAKAKSKIGQAAARRENTPKKK